MLLKRATLTALATGTPVVVFRRWREPRVRAGSTFRTAVGVIAVERIEPAAVTAVTARHAQDAGYASRAAMLAALRGYGDGPLYRLSLRLAGPDHRAALRQQSQLSGVETDRLVQEVSRLGMRSHTGPWAVSVLRLIAARPGVRAADLAAGAGLETAPFKARVRQLKELGLTESLEVGYRLSPRGRALLRSLPPPSRQDADESQGSPVLRRPSLRPPPPMLRRDLAEALRAKAGRSGRRRGP